MCDNKITDKKHRLTTKTTLTEPHSQADSVEQPQLNERNWWMHSINSEVGKTITQRQSESVQIKGEISQKVILIMKT